ncbi:TraR/DksA family transcriptional regulator [Type-D symbiont of Plautia stali]|uniref:TraR/DksA family transcriptional regulator n=1 Tax=Type-D symbiont of Plautia stali TaxID=1560356 RepID=UPI00073F45BE|nr:TraR/DksA family transcriptional regulator [Type-D symbiont of Plautia stali]
MADSMDLVQQRVEEELARNLANATYRPSGASEFFCLSCGEAIPEARRRALPGVSVCVTCKEVSELKSAHYKGAAL